MSRETITVRRDAEDGSLMETPKAGESELDFFGMDSDDGEEP
jgi:hypothetical protein